MDRWEEIVKLMTHLVEKHDVQLRNGILYVDPHAYNELVQQSGGNLVYNGFVGEEVFNIQPTDLQLNGVLIKQHWGLNRHTYEFITAIEPREVYYSGELYHEMKLTEIREERNEKL